MVNQKPIYHPGQAVGYCVLALLVALALPAIFVFAIWILIARKILNQKKVVISGQKNYVFKETTLIEIHTSLLKDVLFEKEDNEWLRIYPNKSNPSQTIIEIDGTQLTGYAWDGCSPKFQLGDLIFGTPDGVIGMNHKPKTYIASMAHDILYQFRDQLFSAGFPFHRAEKYLIQKFPKYGLRSFSKHLAVHLFVNCDFLDFSQQ